MNSRKILFLSVAAVALAAAGFIYLRPPATEAPPASDAPAAAPTTETGAAPATAAVTTAPAITVSRVETAVLTDRVRASGIVGAVERVLVQPKIEGQPVDAVLADVGDKVKAGDVLARLSDTSLKLQKSQLVASQASAEAAIAQANAQLIDAQATYAEAKRTRDRAEQLKAQGNTSQAAYDQAQTSMTSANARVLVAVQIAAAAKAQLDLVGAQIANVDLQLERTQITAPVAGEVVEKNALAGSIASAAGQPMFAIVRDGLLELNSDVAEQDLPRIAVGMPVKLRAVGIDQPMNGTVRLVEPVIDATTRLGRVRIAVDEAALVRAGMFLEAEIIVSKREVTAIPITAVGTDKDGSYIMTVDDTGRVHRTAIQTGVRDGGHVEVVSGAKPGDMVVAKAASFVRDGDQVNPMPADDGPATN